jgi:hypothetical protein
MPNWIKVALRHFATASSIVVILWWVGVPRVQAFINDTVNDRISRIEQMLVTISDRLQHINEQLDELDRKVAHQKVVYEGR